MQNAGAKQPDGAAHCVDGPAYDGTQLPDDEQLYEGAHVVGAGHVLHKPPPTPHAAVEVPATQVPFEQQPPLHG